MVTNYPHTLTAIDTHQAAAPHARTSGFGQHLRQLFCGFHGHDALLHFEDDRLSLRCVSCDHATPGWDLNETPPSVTVRGDARRHMLAQPQLVRVRRVA